VHDDRKQAVPRSFESGGDELRVGEAHALALLDAALDAFVTIDHEGLVREFNLAAERTFGYRREDVLGRELAELMVPPESREAHRTALARWTGDGPTPGAGGLLGRRVEVEAMRSDGSRFPAELAICRVDVPGPPLFTACIRDLTEKREAEGSVRRAESRYRTLVEQLPLAIYIDRIDEASSNIYTSPQIEPMLGYPATEWVSKPSLFLETLHPDDRERVLAAHARSHTTREPLQVEYRLLARDGRVVWVRDEARVIDDPQAGEPVLQGYLLDVTAAKEAEEQLRHQAFHDPLTGLANRALFTDRVEHALVLRGGAVDDVAVLFLDLDDFKTVNDTLGHPTGDALLQAVGERLTSAVSRVHTVARFGGDEFAILVEDVADGASAVDVAADLLAELRKPFHLDGREVFVTASIGIAVGGGPEELLRSADVAMYRAKAAGKSQYVVYAPRMDEDVVDRLELVGALRRASIQEEFVIEYQPTVELPTGALVGVEALLRWQHPTRGLVPPLEFIPLAEETGSIVEIGRWVLREACTQAATWRRTLPGAEELQVSVNVSIRQVRRPGLLEDVREALAMSGLPPEALTLEITESVLARGEMATILEEVSELGVRLALDDFGTGYSSLSLLQNLPVDTLKIDRSFIRSVDGAGRRALVQAIIDLASALDLPVVAEGIEEPEQVHELERLGCRLGQGFYFARPLDPRSFEVLFGTDRAA
jgi:diguanylate cyclase (GGDEF)-like protein/PAS domain S-box-containing protein